MQELMQNLFSVNLQKFREKVKEERPDVIVPTGVLKDTLTDDVPVVVGTCFVTGVGEKATIDKILEILSK